MADNRTCTRRAQTDSISVGGAGGIAFVTGFSGGRISNLLVFVHDVHRDKAAGKIRQTGQHMKYGIWFCCHLVSTGGSDSN